LLGEKCELCIGNNFRVERDTYKREPPVRIFDAKALSSSEFKLVSLKSLKLDVEEPVVTFTDGPYRSKGWVLVCPDGVAVVGAAGLGGEACLLVRDCELSGVGEGIDGIDPRGELALEML